MEEFDIFVSYRRTDGACVVPLVEALRREGLSVWFDQEAIQDFDPITDKAQAGLARSKTFLAWHSKEYPYSRACQMELAAAFIAAQSQGDVRNRIFTVNPETGHAHVEPVELLDQQHLRAPVEPESYLAAAKLIASKINPICGTLGATISGPAAPQYGIRMTSAPRFVGRIPEFWRLHSALHSTESAMVTGDVGPALAQVCGMGGVGKTILVEEYALRFGASYPGGVFWLRALGNETPREDANERAESQRIDQFRSIALALGIDVVDKDPKLVEAAIRNNLASNDKPFIWIVDDLPSGLSEKNLRSWFAPHPIGKTLITTQSREYASIGKSVLLGVMHPEDAYALFCAHRKPEGNQEEDVARLLVADLGFHPLAIDVTAAAFVARFGRQTLQELRTSLAHPTRDELEFAAQLSPMLPTGHETSVAATLLRSVASLGAEGRDVLRLASKLATAPIPLKLIQDAFRRLDGLDDQSAGDRVDGGVKQAQDASLAERIANGAVSVHALVSRTVRFRDLDVTRVDAIHQAVIASLNSIMAMVTDARSHLPLYMEIMHARELCTADLNSKGIARLAHWVAHFYTARGAYQDALILEYPGNARHLAASRRSPFKGFGTDAAQMTVAAGFIVEDFDVVEYVGPG